MPNLVSAPSTEVSFKQQSSLPTRKVVIASAVSAASTIAVWIVNAYSLLPGGKQIPADVALAFTTLLSFIAAYAASPSASDQVVRSALA
jgi:hypothetical protein